MSTATLTELRLANEALDAARVQYEEMAAQKRRSSERASSAYVVYEKARENYIKARNAHGEAIKREAKAAKQARVGLVLLLAAIMTPVAFQLFAVLHHYIP